MWIPPFDSIPIGLQSSDVIALTASIIQYGAIVTDKPTSKQQVHWRRECGARDRRLVPLNFIVLRGAHIIGCSLEELF